MNRFSFKEIALIFAISFLVLGLWQFGDSMQKIDSKVSAAPTPPAQSTNKTQPQHTEYNDEAAPMLSMEALKIKGVSLSTSQTDVFRQLGKPLQSRKGGNFPCGGELMTQYYSGLVIEFEGDEKGRNFTAASMEVSSAKWSISGIRVSADKKDVLAKFSGYKYYKANESDLEVWSYGNGDGWINFYFNGEKLVKVHWEANLC
jgi:hypothetical protein